MTDTDKLVELIEQGYLGHGVATRSGYVNRYTIHDVMLAACWLCQAAPSGTGPTELCDSCIADLRHPDPNPSPPLNSWVLAALYPAPEPLSPQLTMPTY